MNSKIYLLILATCLTLSVSLPAAVDHREWDVGGTKRTGIVCTPGASATQPAAGWPVVFVFHGHGGGVEQIRRQFQIDTLWPEAVVVYLQGLPTVGQLTDPQGN